METASGSIKTRLRSIRDLMLAPTASEGERQNARTLFHMLMEKHGLTEDDLLQPKMEVFKIAIADKFELTILCHTIYKVTGSKEQGFWTRNPYNGQESTKFIWVELTKLDYAEVQLLYPEYCKSLREELERFIRAFVNANDIFPENAKAEERQLSAEEMKELIAMMKMAGAINPVHIPRNYPLLGQ